MDTETETRDVAQMVAVRWRGRGRTEYRESASLNLERFVGGENLLDEAGNPAANPRAEFAAIFELGKANEVDLPMLNTSIDCYRGLCDSSNFKRSLAGSS